MYDRILDLGEYFNATENYGNGKQSPLQGGTRTRYHKLESSISNTFVSYYTRGVGMH